MGSRVDGIARIRETIVSGLDVLRKAATSGRSARDGDPHAQGRGGAGFLLVIFFSQDFYFVVRSFLFSVSVRKFPTPAGGQSARRHVSSRCRLSAIRA